MQDTTQQDNWKRLAGEAAARLIEDGMVLGLGSGSTASYVVRYLGLRIQEGLQIVGAVPTSNATEQLARESNIPLTTLDAHPELALSQVGFGNQRSYKHSLKVSQVW